IFLMLFLSQNSYSQDSWTLFTPDDRIFEVQVPGKMDWGIKHVLTDLGEMQTITYLYKGEEDNPDPVYIINFTKYPKESLHKDSIQLLEDFFHTSLEGIIESLGGELVYYADISSVYTPQKLYKAHYNKGLAAVKGKMIVDNDTFFSIQVFSSFQNSQKIDN